MRSFLILPLASSGMKSSLRRSAHELGLRGRTVGGDSLPQSLPPFFPAPPLSSKKSLSSLLLPLLLSSLVRTMYIFLLTLDVVMLH